jgi:hypothetical protein
MKRIVLLFVGLVMLSVSVGGCFVPWDRGGRGKGPDRGGHYEKGGHHDRSPGHDRGPGQR